MTISDKIRKKKVIREEDGVEIEVMELTREEFLELMDEVIGSIIDGLVIGSKDKSMVDKNEDFKKGYTTAVQYVKAIKNAVKTAFSKENNVEEMGLFK